MKEITKIKKFKISTLEGELEKLKAILREKIKKFIYSRKSNKKKLILI